MDGGGSGLLGNEAAELVRLRVDERERVCAGFTGLLLELEEDDVISFRLKFVCGSGLGGGVLRRDVEDLVGDLVNDLEGDLVGDLEIDLVNDLVGDVEFLLRGTGDGDTGGGGVSGTLGLGAGSGSGGLTPFAFVMS